MPKKNNHKIAIIGSGPAGLACAFELAKKGYLVKIFEALHELGGVLVYGIPEFRLPNDVVKSEIDKLKKLGVEMITNVVIGKTFTIDDLFSMGYEYIFIATGAGLPNFMNIKGENLKGVYSANEFLTRINLMKSYDESSDTPILKAKNVAVIGGGNVAMDAARCAKRLGANNVYIIYRRGMDELPARKEEVFHAKEEGIIFNVLSNIIEIIPDENNCVKKIKCIKMRLGEVDSSNRRKPVEILNSYFYLDVDSVIIAIGTSPNPLIKNSTKNLATDSKGLILTVNNDGLTTLNNVYAGGDAVSNASTVINAMGAGKKAALAIDDEIRTK